MIEGIREIGRYALKKEDKSVDEPLDILIDDPKNRDTKNILFIILEYKDDEFEYRGIDVDEYSEDNLRRYLYKKGSPNGPDMAPTSMVTTIDKTFNNKVLGWFKKYKKLSNDKDINFLVKIGNCIRDNRKTILKDLESKYNKQSNIISLKIDDKYIGEYPVFKRILLDSAKKAFYFTKSFSGENQYSRSDNQICSVCRQKNEVYGFVGTYPFYTVDKPGFVSGGFQQRYAWKNYPVCLNCALVLKEGKKYIEKSLSFNFYGFKYLLIPKFVRGLSDKVKEKVFRIIEDQRDPKFTKKTTTRLTSDESEILQLMSEEENYLNMNFLFYDAPKGYDGSVFNILLYIEDVLPSRLKRLFGVKKEVDDIDIFKECMVPVFENRRRTGEEPLVFNFGVLRTFLSRISERQTYNKYFLDIVDKIFSAKSIDYHFIMSFIIKKIREDFINGYPTNTSTLKGFMLLNYLNKLELLKNFKEVKMVEERTIEISGGEMKEKIEGLFTEFADFFASSAKKAVFLEGVLTQYLLNIQYQERGTDPFRVKLKGLKLDERQIKKLLPEIQNKLEEYGKNYYKELEKMLSGYLVSAGNNWKMTNDEISYYFVLGMNLTGLFKSENKNEKEVENE